jgi:hypothetical protein
MNPINDYMHILIFAGIAFLVFIYLFQWWIRSPIETEISVMKKKIKKMQSWIQMQSMQSNRSQQVESSGHVDSDRLANKESDPDNGDDMIDGDMDSYFDPTKY